MDNKNPRLVPSSTATHTVILSFRAPNDNVPTMDEDLRHLSQLQVFHEYCIYVGKGQYKSEVNQNQ